MKHRCALFAACFLLAACQSSRYRHENSGSASREMPSGNVNVSGPLLSYADVVDHVAPAVVTIRSSKRVSAPQQFPFFDDPFFRQMFGGGFSGGRTPSTVE